MNDSIVSYIPVNAFPGYRVGNDGSVWSKRNRSGRGGYVAWRKMRPAPRETGHLRVYLYTGSSSYTRYVHRLVLEAFVGPCPKGLQCCHYDGDPANNRLNNLRWDTPKANAADTMRHGRKVTLRGEACNYSKLTEGDVRSIRVLISEGRSHAAIGGMFNVSRSAISMIASGRRWRHVS